MTRFVASILLGALWMGAAAGAAWSADEATVKATFLYNITKFIQWPDETRNTLRLCVAGEDGPGKALDSLIGKSVRNMVIGVRHSVSRQEILQCDLVFVPQNQASLLSRVRHEVDEYPILIVTESSGPLPKGAMVAMIQSEDRIVFEIDLTMTRKLGFHFSAKLLQLARKIY